MNPKINFLNLTLAQHRELFQSWGLPAYTADQVAGWVFQRRVFDFEAMTSLSQKARGLLAERCDIPRLTPVKVQASQDGTLKYLLACQDGATVETVMIPSLTSDRKTLCISSQVGCNMGCRFCFTGTQKKQRNLTLSEVLGQVLFVLSEGFTLTNVVYMGMGEPLDNYEVTLDSTRMLVNEKVFRFSHRKVTVSTSGLISPLVRWMKDSNVNIAISLHAPNDLVRGSLMPINHAYPFKHLLDACREHFPRHRKRITFEYVLLKGINDQPKHAQELVRHLHGIPAKINLIAFNPFPGSLYERSDDVSMETFSRICNERGIVATLRKSRGMDILAACGQLKGAPRVSQTVAQAPV
jgi:23S rRNA (adenine2503-C2)-methyltransferase